MRSAREWTTTRSTARARGAIAPWAAVLLALAVALAPRAAPAQDVPVASPTPAPASAPLTAAERRAQARVHFEEGVRLAEALRWQDAIRELEAARALFGTPAVDFNLAVAYRAVGRNRAAIGVFEAFVRTRGVDPARVDEARGYLAALRPTLVRLTVRTHPREAAVSVDGELARGVATAGVVLDPGAHVLVVEAPGWRARTRTVQLDPGASDVVTVNLVPDASAGQLQIDVNTPGARIAVDGEDVSVGSALLALPPGRHTVEVTAAGYAPFRGAVRVVRVGLTRVNVALQRSGSVWTSPWFWLATGAVVAAGIGTAVWFATEPPALQGRFGRITDGP